MTFIFIMLWLIGMDEPPAGMVKVKNLYVDKTEILNIHWQEYLYFKKQETSPDELKQYLPDTLNFWYDDPEYRYKPLVWVTYEQAMDYCAWRSEVVSEKSGRKISFRLPTPAEWKAIATEVLRVDERRATRELKRSHRLVRNDASDYPLSAVENLDALPGKPGRFVPNAPCRCYTGQLKRDRPTPNWFTKLGSRLAFC